jgi:hypothetical protein
MAGFDNNLVKTVGVAAVGVGVIAGVAYGGAVLIGAFSVGYQTVVGVTAITLTLIGFSRLEGDSTVKIQGVDAAKKVGFIQGIQNLFKGVFNTIVNLPKTLPQTIEGVGTATVDTVMKVNSFLLTATATAIAAVAILESKSGSSISPTAAITPLIQNSAAINPAQETLGNSAAAVTYFATNTDALFWSTCTSTTIVGYEWWNVQQKFANTGTGSYFQILSDAIHLTNALTGIVPNNGIMTIRQIIDASSTSTTIDYAALGLVVPNIPDYAGTLYNTDYINSATIALTNLIVAGDTATTTLVELRDYEAVLDTDMANLADRINKDVTNQAKYLSQSRHLENVLTAANILNSIRQTQPSDIVAFYESTIHPTTLDAINKMNTLMDLTSINSSTVSAALTALANAPVPTFNTAVNVNGITILGMPDSVARGKSFIVGVTNAPASGTVTYLDQGNNDTGTFPISSAGNGQFVVEFLTSRSTGTTNISVAFSDGTTTTFAVTLV